MKDNNPDDIPADGEDSLSSERRLPPSSRDWNSRLGRDADEVAASTSHPAGTVSEFVTAQRVPVSPSAAVSGIGSDSELDAIVPRASRRALRAEGSVSAASLPPKPPYPYPMGFSDLLIAILLGVIAFFAIVSTYHGIGESWDESLYVKPAERAFAWMRGVVVSNDYSLLKSDWLKLEIRD